MRRFTSFLIPAALVSSGIHAQAPASASRFEVATIRLNNDCAGSGREQLSPGRFGLQCVSLRDVIRVAYGNPGGPFPARPPEVLGGPRWLDTDRYDIQATAAGNAGLDQMYGAMTRSLLEDRFRLRLHDESRKLPVYNLTVPGKAAKLKPIEAGACVPVDLRNVLQSPPPPNYCGRNTLTRRGTTIFDGYGVTIPEFITRALRTLNRPVIDLTQLPGRFDIHLEFVPTDVPIADDAGPSIFTAIQEQLGLKLSPSTGRVQVHVIDRVERPSEN